MADRILREDLRGERPVLRVDQRGVLGIRRRRAYEILVSIGTSDHINFVGVPRREACRNVIVSVVPLIVGLTVPWPPSW